MATWGSVASWDFATWSFPASGPTWDDLGTWESLTVWFEPGAVVDRSYLPAIRGLDLDDGTITAVERVTATMRPLTAVAASMRAVGSDGASIGPASASAASVTLAAEGLAPSQRMVAVVAVHPAVHGYQLTVNPVDVFPTEGMPAFYGATQPTYSAGPFLWFTTDGDVYLVEP